MKKYLAIFLSFIIIFTAALAAVQVFAADDSDNFQYTEHTISGDKSQLEGIRINTLLHCDSHLFWNVGYTMGENPTYDVEFEHLYSEPKQNSTSEPMFELHFGLNSFGASSSRDVLGGNPSLFGQAEMAADVAAQTPAGETRSMLVYVSDYYEYYPISLSMNINDVNCHDLAFHRDSSNPKYSEMLDSLSDKLNEYFKIPVDPDDQKLITVEKREDGSIATVNSDVPDKNERAYMNTFSLVSDSAIYFLIEPKSESGNETFDMSMIEGGVGIYRIPYEVTENDSVYYNSVKTYTNVKADELEMVYPLDEEMTVEAMALSDDQSVIYLTTRHSGATEDEIRLTVIDVATMTAIQETVIFTCTPDEFISVHSYNENFILYKIAYRKYAVVEKADGIWRTAFVVEDDSIHDLWSSAEFLIQYYNTSAAYDGERLVIAAHSTERGGNGMEVSESYLSSFYLSVYSAEGNLYTGKFTSTLDTGTFLSYNEICRPTDDNKIEIILP